MEKWLLFLAFYVLFFSNLEGYATTIQIIGVSLIILAACIAVASRRVVGTVLSSGEIIVLLMCVFSVLAGIVTLDSETLSYTVIFSLTFCSIALLVRALDLHTIMDMCAYAFMAVITTILVTDGAGFLTGISGQLVEGVGLFRFRPFGLHPNLVGFVFGAGSILLFFVGSESVRYRRFVFIVFSGLSLAFVFAASARAGLVAFVAAPIFLGLFRLRLRIQRQNTLTFLASSVAVGVAAGAIFANLETVSGYFIRILDLENPLRGLESGGTGRTDLWRMSVDELALRNYFELAFGTGFRSSSAEKIGYNTESSYFTALLENGIVLGHVFYLFVFFKAVRTSRMSRTVGGNLYLAVGALLFFALTQSTFNRYLLAVGNPFSVLLVFFYFSLTTQPATRPARPKRPAVVTSAVRTGSVSVR